ncbi:MULTISPECIES: alpha-ketoacid dehydrogenase subunit beta [unclassified Streptomyces]|uniref:alpha-ketoacid dehydrogenase subunit beta n=1 Tax=unclassified Streptomyces TaxID=2593676 RepID=UPI0022B6FD70|nr:MULTISPECIES: alpha-ketoacid dehydrogenase subunit beta [unclassified Streptomyces]MCZ7416440.1 alpha-ketoacid dehydrogenase subunit beta [Streptomyces sp. WMMC897]MCZ7433749.1 alpha-ketoacid dehydrogenase subunit beta [Streptomyces sp. WMMC1477]
MTRMTYSGALNAALREEMRRDESVVLLGEDIGVYGGVFSVTRGLLEEFGAERVMDTPISENGIVGAAVGMAMSGLRPVVEMMYTDFMTLALDSIANAASVFPFAYGGQVRVPLVIRTQGGAGVNAGPQHSKSLEAWTAHLPGIHTVMPSTPADAKGLLTAALRGDDPVVLVEHKLLYGTEGPVPSGEHVVPLGTARVVRPGRDVSVLALSRMVGEALTAAERLAEQGVEAEVVDVRSLRPLDLGTLTDSVRRTGRAVVVTESWVRYGPTAEIAAAVTESVFAELRAPVVRLGSLGVPYPASPALEPRVLPDAASIQQSVEQLIKE